MSERRAGITPRVVLGLVLATVGVLWTLDNLRLVDADRILRFWPAALLAWGLMRLTGLGCDRRPVGGIVIAFIGGWLILRQLGIVPWEIWDFWPVILIVLGGSLIGRSLVRSRPADDPRGGSSDLHTFAFWSSVDRTVTAQGFRGGDITAIMGGQEIDLRQARIAGGAAVLDVFVWWGGVEILVPDNWRVKFENAVVLGAMDGRVKQPAGEPAGTLVVRGLVVMGGIEVKN